MSSIVAKKKANKLYYYVVESARVDGKPRIVHQTYLGTAERHARRCRDRFGEQFWVCRRRGRFQRRSSRACWLSSWRRWTTYRVIPLYLTSSANSKHNGAR